MPLPVTPSAWTLAPMYEKQPLLPMQPWAQGTRCRSIGTCVLKSFAAKGSNCSAKPCHSASLGLPFSPHVCDERFQVGHTILNNVCVGQTQDVDSPPGVKHALYGTVGPGVTQRAAHCQ